MNVGARVGRHAGEVARLAGAASGVASVEHRALAGARRTILSARANHAGAGLREAAGDALAFDAALIGRTGLAGAGVGHLDAGRFAGRAARAHHRRRGSARIVLAGAVQADLAARDRSRDRSASIPLVHPPLRRRGRRSRCRRRRVRRGRRPRERRRWRHRCCRSRRRCRRRDLPRETHTRSPRGRSSERRAPRAAPQSLTEIAARDKRRNRALTMSFASASPSVT